MQKARIFVFNITKRDKLGLPSEIGIYCEV